MVKPKIPEVPNEIYELLNTLNSYNYGYIVNGIIETDMERFFDNYKSLTIKEFEKYKTGVCWDYVHYEANWFKSHGYKYETFYIQVQDEDNDCSSHTYLIFYLPGSNMPYYFESSWGNQGIEKFKNITELHNTIKDRHIRGAQSKCNPNTYFRQKYDAASKSWEGLSCGEYMVKVSKGKIKLSESNIYYNSEYLEERMIANMKDIYYNKDKFDSGEINICFITGHSGSGKSTMGRDMASNNIEHYDLDDVVYNKEKFTMDELKEYGDLIYSFFNGIGKKYYYIKDDVENGTAKPIDKYEEKLLEDFIDYSMKYAKAHKDIKFVIEGLWLLDYIEPEQLKDYAVYIKGTSLLKSTIRAANRDSKYEKDMGNNRVVAWLGRASKIGRFAECEKFLKKYQDYFSKLLLKEAVKYYPYDFIIPINESYYDAILPPIHSNVPYSMLDFEPIQGRIEIKEPVYEGVFINQDDIYYNMEKFESGKNKVLYITGYSGSGKSTLAKQIIEENDDIVFISGDYFTLAIIHNLYGNVPEKWKLESPIFKGGDYIKRYLLVDGNWMNIKRHKTKDKNAMFNNETILALFHQFCIWLEEESKMKRCKNRFVVEGCQVALIPNLEFFKDKPLIIKGTSAATSYIRKQKRDFSRGAFSWDKVKNSMIKMIPNYCKLSKQIDLMQDIMDESAKENSYTFLDISKNKQDCIKYLKQHKSKYTKYIDNYNGEVVIDPNKDIIIGEVFVGKVGNDKGFITGLWVRDSYRQHGIGSKLLEDAIQKYNGIDLIVAKDNDAAIGLYKNYGFKNTKSVMYDNKEHYWMALKESVDEDDKEYGLPSLKKYPMPDEKHVLSAIRFFNYVSPENEKELARNIKKKMKQYNISPDRVGDKNRLKKYLKEDSDIISEYSFNTFNHDKPALVFDLGSVLVEYNKPIKDAIADCKVIPNNIASEVSDYILNTFNSNSKFLDCAASEDYYKFMMDNAPAHIKKYIPAALKADTDNTYVLSYTENLLKQLVLSGYDLYYLSNWSKWSRDALIQNKKFDFLKYFKGGVFSCDVGCMKPDKEIYQIFMNKYNIEPGTSVFFDDKPENIEAAISCNMNGIIFNKDYTPQYIIDNFIKNTI